MADRQSQADKHEDTRTSNLFEYGIDIDTRRIYLNDGIDSETCEALVKAIHYLEHKDSKRPIQLHINTPGGSVDDMYYLYDNMKISPCRIVTIGTGAVCSAGGPILAAGDLRLCTNRALFMAHPMSGITIGQSEEIEAQAKIIKKCQELFWDTMAAHTNMTKAEWKRLVHNKREVWFDADEMLQRNIVDYIIKPGQNIEKVIADFEFPERVKF